MDLHSNHTTGGVHLNKTQTKKCTSIPPNVNSNGWLQNEHSLTASLPILELHMFAIFLISHGCHFILKRYGIHILVSQILVRLHYPYFLKSCASLVHFYFCNVIQTMHFFLRTIWDGQKVIMPCI